MKIFFRMPRNLKSSVIFTLLFCMLFPWSLMAETTHKAPKNSLSYFLENAQDSQESPEAKPEEPQMSGFEEAPVETAAAPRIDRQAAVEAIRAKLQAAAKTTEANEVAEPTEIIPAPEAPEAPDAVLPDEKIVETATEQNAEPAKKDEVKAAKTPAPEKTETTVSKPIETKPDEAVAATPVTANETLQQAEEYVPFAGVLTRMQQNRAHRAAQAEKLGVILPSQGGDIATVSPSLSKMQQAIKTIMNR